MNKSSVEIGTLTFEIKYEFMMCFVDFLITIKFLNCYQLLIEILSTRSRFTDVFSCIDIKLHKVNLHPTHLIWHTCKYALNHPLTQCLVMQNDIKNDIDSVNHLIYAISLNSNLSLTHK